MAEAPSSIGVSVADVNPDFDPDGVHAALVVELLESLLGPSPNDNR